MKPRSARPPFGVWRGARDIGLALGIVLGARAVSTLFLLVGASRQVALDGRYGDVYVPFRDLPAAPSLWLASTNWDGQYYWQIALDGYPDGLPVDASGEVVRNRWAFYPLFPLICRGLMTVMGAGSRSSHRSCRSRRALSGRSCSSGSSPSRRRGSSPLPACSRSRSSSRPRSCRWGMPRA